MRQYPILYFSLLLISVIFLAGCTQQPTPKEPEVTYNAFNIKLFDGTTEQNVIRFRFMLEDQQGNVIPSDGQVSLTIKDSYNKTVYTSSFNVKAEQFKDLFYTASGLPAGKAYEWLVPITDVKKSVSWFGNVKLTFTASNGKVLTSELSYLDIPMYSDEEINQIFEDKWIQSATNVSVGIIKDVPSWGNFEVTLLRYGYYKHLKYGTSGDEITDFRIDFKVKNVGTSKGFVDFYPVIIDTSNDKRYKFTEISKAFIDILPGQIEEGYGIFDGFQLTDGQVKVLFDGADAIAHATWKSNYVFTVDLKTGSISSTA